MMNPPTEQPGETSGARKKQHGQWVRLSLLLLLLAAGVRLGDNYPRPVVEHAGARDRALLAYEQVKRAKAEERRGL